MNDGESHLMPQVSLVFAYTSLSYFLEVLFLGVLSIGCISLEMMCLSSSLILSIRVNWLDILVKRGSWLFIPSWIRKAALSDRLLNSPASTSILSLLSLSSLTRMVSTVFLEDRALSMTFLMDSAV